MQRTQQDIENILNSLDGIQRAEARPFMFTRVMARLKEENNIWSRAVSFIARPAIAVACLLSVIIANIYFVTNAGTTSEQETVTATTNGSVAEILQNDNYVLAVNDMNP